MYCENCCLAHSHAHMQCWGCHAMCGKKTEGIQSYRNRRENRRKISFSQSTTTHRFTITHTHTHTRTHTHSPQSLQISVRGLQVTCRRKTISTFLIHSPPPQTLICSVDRATVTPTAQRPDNHSGTPFTVGTERMSLTLNLLS